MKSVYSFFCVLIVGSMIILSGCSSDKDKNGTNTYKPVPGQIYPAGSSFQKIVMEGDKTKCAAERWNVRWESKHDVILPKDIFVPFVQINVTSDSGNYVFDAPPFDEAISKIYMSLLENHTDIKDKSFMNMVIVHNGCSLTVKDK
ncbi:hypothetical protein [Enterobacter hormaechei]|uniref:hypothetical protein n=1 Tax=Enterobacter hormaechei TaxID=158836 RepID=UPI00356B35E3